MIEIKTGDILIATPMHTDSDFNRAVVFITEHDEEGTVGFILNQMSNLKVQEAIESIHLDIPLYFGGPDSKNTIIFLHRCKELNDSIALLKDLYTNGELEDVVELIRQNKITENNIRFFAGRKVWEPGQLEKELKQDKWWRGKITADDIFETETTMLWAIMAGEQGHIYSMFDQFPDPSIN